MAKRRWTVVLVPHTAEPSKVVEVSYGVLKSLAAAVGVVAVLALLLGYAAVSRTTDQQRTTTGTLATIADLAYGAPHAGAPRFVDFGAARDLAGGFAGGGCVGHER